MGNQVGNVYSSAEDVNRLRSQGASYGQRQFAPINYGSANQLAGTEGNTYGSALQQAQSGYGMRNQQADATGLMRDAATGNAPSQAEIAGRQAMQQGLQNRLAAAAGARGGVESQASAMNAAQAGNSQYEQNAIQGIAAARAGEMAQARQAYGSQLAQVRGQDYAGAGLMGQLGAQQANQAQAQGAYSLQGTALNQQGQIASEGMAMDSKGMEQQSRQAEMNRLQQNADRNQRYFGSAMSAAGSILGGMFSDERTKVPASLGDYMVSDDEAKVRLAKREAFWEGAQYGQKPGSGATPDYAQYGRNAADIGQVSRYPESRPAREMETASEGVTKIARHGTKATLEERKRSREVPEQGSPVEDTSFLGRPDEHRVAMKRVEPYDANRPAPATRDERPSYGLASQATPPRPGEYPSLASTAVQQDANRAGAGFAYAYKPNFTPPTQAPGEVNYGPSAQTLAANPLTATTVKQTPDGLLAIDKEKLLKSNTAGIASLQEQIDQMRGGR